jgi:hypothetical protein
VTEKPAHDPVFDNAPGNTSAGTDGNTDWQKAEQERLTELKAKLPGLLREQEKRSRAEQFYPYLLVRSFPGDRGDRPINNIPFWESPDIWIAIGEPSSTPEIPPNPGGRVVMGGPLTIYAHVWNLGRAPIIGVNVEFYWFTPFVAINGTNAKLIGYATVDLGPRSSDKCHKLVKCPVAWRPLLGTLSHN